MTQKEVEDILGGPPGNYAAGSGRVWPGKMFSSVRDRDRLVLHWLGDGEGVAVEFGKGGRVTSSSTFAGEFGDDGLLGRLRRRLGVGP